MAPTHIYPPFSYKWDKDSPLDWNDTEGMRATILNMLPRNDHCTRSDVQKADKKDLRFFFKENGYEFVKE